MIDKNGLLFIEPHGPASATPVVDGYTQRMTAALVQAVKGTGTGRQFRPGSGYRGWHNCSCGAMSSNCNYLLSNGMVTNSLCVHYLASHRAAVPAAELRKVAALPAQALPPTSAMITGRSR